MKVLREIQAPIILYTNDDPTGSRDGSRFARLRDSLSLYDLCAVVRKVNVEEFYSHGARSVIRVPMSYDEVVHRPLQPDEMVEPSFKSDVCFVGTWRRGERREQLLRFLSDCGITMKIWGSRWEKCPDQELVDRHFQGSHLAGRDYVKAIASSEVALSFLSHGNRDLHTRRSVEIPYAGGLLYTERTSEHEEMFKDGHEAVFWSSPKELVEACLALVNDKAKRHQIREAGMKRVRNLKTGNEDVCKSILEAAFF